MRDPDFPNWKHILILLSIYLVGSGVAAIPLLIVGLVALLNGEISTTDPEFIMSQIDPQWMSHLAPVMQALPLVLACWYGWVKLGKPSWRLGFEDVRPGAGLLAVAGTLLIANGSSMIAEYLPGYEAFAEMMEQMLIPGVGMALAIIIGAPVFEEALFRGIILRGYLRKAPPWKGIVFSGLMFGALHVLPVHVFFASLVGFALGYVYYRTRSLGLVILIHFLNNGSSYWMSQTEVPATWAEITGWTTGSIFALAAVTTALGVGALYLLGKLFALVPAPAEEGTTTSDLPQTA